MTTTPDPHSDKPDQADDVSQPRPQDGPDGVQDPRRPGRPSSGGGDLGDGAERPDASP